MLKVKNIVWSADGDLDLLAILPTEMIIPKYLEILYRENEDDGLDEIAEWLSDEIGFCHEAFKIVRV